MTLTARSGLIFSVIVAALGYFVDLYDIAIFGIVRVASLSDLGMTGADNTRWGIYLFNLQMIGLLLGGLLWGVIGDKFGRRFALLATIACYSLANIANAFVTTIDQYAWLRLVAGIGLAGELGAGVALVSELLPAHRRGYGILIISFLGMCGALAAACVGGWFHWRTAYLVGGLGGLVVLAGRWWGLRESALFEESRRRGEARGDLRLLVQRGVLLRLLAVIAVGMPIWFVSGLLVAFAPEYGKAMGLAEPLRVAPIAIWQSIGLAFGSAVSGFASEWLRSRRRVLAGCIVAILLLVVALLRQPSAAAYGYTLFVIGVFQGYWTVYLAMAAEQFGTNIRATVSTSVPNFVRGTTVPMTLAMGVLAPWLGWLPATAVVGAIVFLLALAGLWTLEESFGRNLDFQEGVAGGGARAQPARETGA